MARRRRAEEPGHGGGGGGGHGGGAGRWLVSYADFITLMMVVFMVLYSMASVDSGKYSQLKASLAHSSIGGAPLPVGGNPTNTAPVMPGPDPDSAPGQPAPSEPETAVPAPPIVLPSDPGPEPPAPAPEPEPEPEPEPSPAAGSPQPESTSPPVESAPPADPMQTVVDQFRNTDAARAGQLSVTIQDRGVVATVVTSLLFPEGSAELKPEAAAILDQISDQLQNVNDSIVVEGSPDAAVTNAPWDLAARRASAVVSYLVDSHVLAPHRFAVIGYGKGDGVQGIVNVVVLRK